MTALEEHLLSALKQLEAQHHAREAALTRRLDDLTTLLHGLRRDMGDLEAQVQRLQQALTTGLTDGGSGTMAADPNAKKATPGRKRPTRGLSVTRTSR